MHRRERGAGWPACGARTRSGRPCRAAGAGFGRRCLNHGGGFGGRLGFAAGPRTLLYAKAGYVNGAIDVRYDDGTTVTKARPKGDGYRIGAGIEQQLGILGPKSYARLEYRYSNYGNIDYAGTSIAANIDRHQILVGLGLRF